MVLNLFLNLNKQLLQDDFMLVIARDFDVIDDDDDDVDLDYDDNRSSRRRNTKDSSDTIKLLFHAGKPQVWLPF